MTDEKPAKPKETQRSPKIEKKDIGTVLHRKAPLADSAARKSQRITSEQKPPEKPKKSS